MKKDDVLKLWGGAHVISAAMGITYQAVMAWPDTLPKRLQDEIVGLTLRMEGLRRAQSWFPHYFTR